jgi:hypothetical protein
MHAGGVTFNATFYGVLVLYRPEPSAASAHEEVGNALAAAARSAVGGGGVIISRGEGRRPTCQRREWRVSVMTRRRHPAATMAGMGKGKGGCNVGR